MKNRKLLTGISLAIAVLIFSTFMGVNKAGAWGWYGFSGLCYEGQTRGPEGSVIKFTLKNVVVYTQCYNINGEQLGQPGVGNLGLWEWTANPEADPTKNKGWVSIAGCQPLTLFDEHCVKDELNPLCEHIHTCHPLDNKNKIEQPGSAWIAEFVADWVWYKTEEGALAEDEKDIIDTGRDTCTWTGVLDPDTGVPEHDAPFDCIEEVCGKKGCD